MSQPPSEGAQLYRRAAWIATGLTVGLIALGGYVRIRGAGMGCSDHWPLCNGRLFPNLTDPLEVLEWSHRWVAVMVSTAIAALAYIGWRRHRHDPYLRNPAILSAVLLVLQVFLGAVTVWLWNAAPSVVIHLTNAMILLAVLVSALLRSGDRLLGRDPAKAAGGRSAKILPGFALVVVLFGALVANYDAGLYCLGFPLCGGSWAPPEAALGRLQWVHRVLAFLFLGHTIGVAVASRRLVGQEAPAYRQAAWTLAGLTLLQVALGAAMMLQMMPGGFRAAHLLVGSLVWVAALVVAFRGRRLSHPARRAGKAVAEPAGGGQSRNAEAAASPVAGGALEAPGGPATASPSLLADLITLTKPRIISLLLLTTLLPMVITDRGLPSPMLVLWVMLGGYLMAGGANTVNMWFDRDIDTLMSRTKLRPIPSGRIPAPVALAVGLAQGALAFWIFWTQVNPLSAWLAFGGYLFYIFVYTVWLKRLSPQNIVIGGAAGAFPPLVGWTAMTGSLDLTAIYLFAIIFFWTPPHFWALALIKRTEYANAGVPMMPVVRGERWTKIQMLAYTLMLIPLTVMPAVFGALGLFYGVAALLLGGRLLWYSVRVLREAGVTPTAWKMYKFSLLYLALLFVAMGVDRAVPFGHGLERSEILILDQPEQEAMGAGAEHQGH
jgi:protoheme IX farnesyltransferase